MVPLGSPASRKSTLLNIMGELELCVYTVFRVGASSGSLRKRRREPLASGFKTLSLSVHSSDRRRAAGDGG